MKKRSILELWRFIASLCILLVHSNALGFKDYIFQSGWIYVEFFFMITGYFTISHFCSHPTKTTNIAENSIRYTFKKFGALLPYTTITIVVISIFEFLAGGCKSEGLLLDIFPEVTLTVSTGSSVIGALWFITILLTIFPLFCCFCQIPNKHYVYIIAFTISTYFYYIYDLRESPNVFLRAIAGLCLGVLIYYFVYIINQISFNKFAKTILTIIEQCSLLFCLIAICFNKENCIKNILFFFFIGITLMLSDTTYTSQIESKFLLYLGQLSMIIFVIHQPIGKIMHYFNCNNRIVWILITILVASLFRTLVNKIRNNDLADELKHVKL